MGNDITIGGDGFYHPINEEQIKALILRARAQGQQIRVRGSGHSVAAAIYTNNHQRGMVGLSGINVMLDQMRKVSFIEGSETADSILVRVEAGCNLGQDPHDPTATSTWQNSFVHQLHEKGWALPDTGGIIHQTVAGFISTGSSGGSLKYSVGDAIETIEFIDGTGKSQVATRSGEVELFQAVGVSMGLLGIITAVTFRCVKRFAIKGTEVSTSEQDCAIDLFGDGGNGKPSLQQFLTDTEYTRLMWWPQKGVEQMVVWQAQRIPYDPQMEIKPYVEVGRAVPNSPLLTYLSQIVGQSAGSAFYILVGTWPQWFNALMAQEAVRLKFKELCMEDPKTAQALLEAIRGHSQVQAALGPSSRAQSLQAVALGEGDATSTPESIATELLSVLEELYKLFKAISKTGQLSDLINSIICKIIKAFVQRDPQEFQDTWYDGLPMDNQISDVLMPTEFTELWIPLSCTRDVMRTLKDFYVKGGMAATGTFSCEIYATKASEFWMSPSHEEPVVRVDIFWFAYDLKEPTLSFYPQYWELLQQFSFRPHWAKYLPAPSSSTGVDYLRRCYPRWSDFMRLRDQLDPDQVFVTDYWRLHLGIPAAAARAVPKEGSTTVAA